MVQQVLPHTLDHLSGGPCLSLVLQQQLDVVEGGDRQPTGVRQSDSAHAPRRRGTRPSAASTAAARPTTAGVYYHWHNTPAMQSVSRTAT
jgi:hypothetical protein